MDIELIMSTIDKDAKSCNYEGSIKGITKVLFMVMYGVGECLDSREAMREEIAELRKSNDSLALLIAQEYES